MALASPARVILYGGQAGGGKSDFAVGCPLREHHATTIFRRQGVQLPDLIRRAKAITEGFRSGFNGQTNLLTLPGGAFLEFAGLNEPDDWMKWKGRRRDCWVFDEATEFLRSQVFSLIGWLGSSIAGQRLRMILTFNPPTTPEGEWINELLAPWMHLLDESQPPHALAAECGEVRWFVQVGDPEQPDSNRVEWVDGPEKVTITGEDGRSQELIPISATFIRASVRDNKYLASDEDYIASLMALPEPLRSQALYGKWNAGQKADPWQVLPTTWVVAAQQRWSKDGGSLAPLNALGVDVAQGGADRFVLAPRHEDWIAPLKVFPGKETPDGKAGARKIGEALEEAEASSEISESLLVNVDALGVGANTLAACTAPEPEGLGLRGVQPILGQQKSEWMPTIAGTHKSGKLRCRNLRAEMYWRLRLALDPEQPGGAKLALPPGSEILRDLCAARFKVMHGGTAEGGVVQIEEKSEIKKRLRRSPDLADAIALSMLPRIVAPTEAEPARAFVASIHRSDAGRSSEGAVRPSPVRRPIIR